MARKRRGRRGRGKVNPIRKGVKIAAGGLSAATKGGFVLVPVAMAATQMAAGSSLSDGINTLVWEATGYEIRTGKFNTTKFTEVAARDLMLFAGGWGLSKLSKRV